MATLTTTQTSPSLLGGRGDYRRHHYWRRDVFSASGHVRGVVLWSMAALIFTWFCMLHSGLMILEANLNYRIGSSFDTITKDLLGKGWNVVNGISIAFVLYILTYAYYFCQWFDSASHLRRDVAKTSRHGQRVLVLHCWWRLWCG